MNIKICPKCRNNHHSDYEYKKKPRGGYRLGSGRGKFGYYLGIYCNSTYELCWVIYNLDHQIKFSRFPGYLEGLGLKYYPDFLLEDGKTIIEIKGFEPLDKIRKKIKLAISYGYEIQILYKKDLEYCFRHVKEKYKTSDFATLYDNYKPLYSYQCNFCRKHFNSNKKRQTVTIFCSQSCSGKNLHKNRSLANSLAVSTNDDTLVT